MVDVPRETKVKEGTLGYDLLNGGIFGNIYTCSECMNSGLFRPVGLSVSTEDGSHVPDTTTHVIVQRLYEPTHGMPIEHTFLGCILDARRNLEAEKIYSPVSLEGALADESKAPVSQAEGTTA